MSDAELRGEANIGLVKTYLEKWNRGDLAGVLAMMDDDAVFGATTGPGPGKYYRGKSEIAAAIKRLVSPDSTLRITPLDFYPANDTVIMTWTSVDLSLSSNERMRGIDHFQIRNGKIILKEAYRKVYA